MKRFFIVFLLSYLSECLYSLPSPPAFSRLTTNEGLSNGEINCIVKDSRGLLWIGTNDGLNCYNGDNITIFKNEPGNPGSLGGKAISAIVEDNKGMLWIATYGAGLDCFNRKTMQFTHYVHNYKEPGSLVSNYITAMIMDSKGELWIGTGSGLDRFGRKGKSFIHYTWKNKDNKSISRNSVLSLYIDRAGVLWIGTHSGLNRYNPGTGDFTRYLLEKMPTDRGDITIINVIYEDKNQNFWLGTHGGGLLMFDRTTGEYTQYKPEPANPASINGSVVYAIGEDCRDNFWVGTWIGCNLFDPGKGTFTGYQGNIPELYKNFFLTIYTDNTGITWIGSCDGINILYPPNPGFRSYSTGVDSTTLLPGSVSGFCEDAGNRLWIATLDNGIKCIDRETGKMVSYKSFFQDNSVQALYTDQAGTTWVGTERGLVYYAEKTDSFKQVGQEAAPGTPPGLCSIRTICEDESYNLWIVTADQGLYRLDQESKVWKAYFNNRENNQLYAMCPARAGGLWIAAGTELKRFNSITGEFTHYPPVPGSIPGTILQLYEDTTGTLWVGGNGLNRFNPLSGRYDLFAVHKESAGDPVYGILEDQKHNLWISTSQGLSRFDPATGQFTHFDQSHGLPGNSFNPAACYKSSRGELFFGTADGFVSFFPGEFDLAVINAPDVVLTSFKQDGEAVNLHQFPEQVKAIRLANDKNYFDFTFAANTTLYPLENQYAYKLAGYDTEWHYCGLTGSGSYKKLPVKNYTLQLKSSSQYGYWNGNTTKIRITVTPIVWREWYMYMVYAFLGIAFLFFIGLIVRAFIQARQLKRKKQELEQEKQISEGLRKVDKLKDEFLATTSHELRTPLNGMINLADSLLNTPGLNPGAEEALAMIVASGRRLSNLINDILDFSKLKTGTLEITRQAVDVRILTDFVLKISQVLAGHKNLTLVNRITDNIPPVYGDEDRIQQILFNLVGNAVKFTEKGFVEISAACNGDTVWITVADTGIGIQPDKQEEIFEPFKKGADSYRGTGLGLYITKQLVALHGGSIRVDSSPGQGTRFNFSLPVSRSLPVPGQSAKNLSNVVALAGAPLGMITTQEPAPGFATATLLIIDDEPVNQFALAGQLAQENYHLIHAYDGMEGLKYITGGQKIDLVLLDLMLPHIDGFEVCRQIRNRYQLYELPVIMVTAQNQVMDLVKGFSAGANDYLAKPFLKDELLARIKTQLNLAKYDLLKEITEQKTNFFINLAHETRTPLTLISNYLDSYIKKQGIDDELKGIQFHIEKLTVDIMNFLDYEKLEKGQVFYDHSQVCDFSEIAGQQLALFREAALRRGIMLSAQITAGLYVKADHAALERIINNILENAVKFTAARENGDAKRIGVTLESHENKVSFAVRDNGIGIPDEAQEHIFEKYYQVSHKKRNIQGNGMGLALTAALVRDLGGTIAVESRLHQGSCFTVTLNSCFPATGETVQQYTASIPYYGTNYCISIPVEENIQPGKFNILIVEDTIELSSYLHSCMKDKYNIYLAFTGKEALEKLESIPCPDLIISDIMMDEMDGYAFFRNLSGREQYRVIPFIVMTARGSLDEKIRSLHSGILDYIFKPFLVDELLAKIDSVLRYEQMRKNFYERDKYAALGTLLSGISHELLNPLSGITGPIGNLRKYLELSGKYDTESREYLEMMEKNTKRISGLVKNLKLLYYQDEVKKEVIDFEKIMHSIKELFFYKIQDRITIHSGVTGDFSLTANPSILSHILINLVSNAVDSIQEQGIIRIVASREDALHIIRVSDTGRGMSREVMTNIFNPFYTTKKDYNGLGLGLYIVKDLVLRMGWKLGVHSEPGKGSEFVIQIPR